MAKCAAKIMLWEIMVPTSINYRPVRARFHRVWAEKVRKISNGLTIMTPAKGYWVDEEGKSIVEKMIPVRIACTEDQIRVISDITAKYYKQKAIMYYLLSKKVIIKHYD